MEALTAILTPFTAFTLHIKKGRSKFTKNKEIMKLELKHLAPYLPYGLKVLSYQRVKSLRSLSSDTLYLYGNVLKGYTYKECKPILRPLSDLTKDNVAEFYQLDSIDLELIDIDEWTEELIHMINAGDKFQLRQFNLLFSWHFDIFNLIPQGLAIDINTLNP